MRMRNLKQFLDTTIWSISVALIIIYSWRTPHHLSRSGLGEGYLKLILTPLTAHWPHLLVSTPRYQKITEILRPGKRGHIVADTLLPTKMFPHLPARATFAADTNCESGTQKLFLIFVQKHFVPAANVSQFAHPKKHHEQHCVRNNVSSFARAFMSRRTNEKQLINHTQAMRLKNIAKPS